MKGGHYITFLLTTLSVVAFGQTNRTAEAPFSREIPQITANSNPIAAQQAQVAHAEQVRATCIQGRRMICGRILEVLPEGLVVESGYTNLLREPLTRSWLVPGTVTASRTPNLLEASQPDAMCIGLVFLTDAPRSKRLTPKRYDYVIIQGYPAGQHTYTSLGTISRTVRRFSAVLEKAVTLNLEAEPPAQATK